MAAKYLLLVSSLLALSTVTLGSSFQLYCIGNAFEENAANQLLNGDTYDYCKLPQNFLLEQIYIRTTSPVLTSNVSIALGYSDKNEAFVPFSYGLNSDMINSDNLIFTPRDFVKGVSVDQALVTLTPSDRLLGGQLELFIKGEVLPL